ncbi:hypothetical protein POVWA1_045730 [Plasmodium ovale wallikeri]|uniref:Uncharacterized protein n=1 Tax=Plasmodium ovale wallikeri TaxID=864142 RepID=A0A1A8ZEP3_PLAOA|nr:hypothetical protein POVWA1_045730 [Plasmodium ovale wallikeri]
MRPHTRRLTNGKKKKKKKSSLCIAGCAFNRHWIKWTYLKKKKKNKKQKKKKKIERKVYSQIKSKIGEGGGFHLASRTQKRLQRIGVK